MNATRSVSPIAIGGIGGSGTRVVAHLIQQLGWYLGDDLNHSMDNLWFTLLFKRRELWPLEINREEIQRLSKIFAGVMSGQRTLTDSDTTFITNLAEHDRLMHPREWLLERVQSLAQRSSAMASRERNVERWGWKEPNTHIVLPVLWSALPDLHYIHVVRHGLDMAFSDNQNQLRLWGDALMNRAVDNADYSADEPENSFRYWAVAHRRVMKLGEEKPDQFLTINFDDLCRSPAAALERLSDFLGISIPADHINALVGDISAPQSKGRHRNERKLRVREEDLITLNSLGFESDHCVRY